MKLFFTILATLVLLTSPTLASHNGKDHPPLQTITVKVDGLVCDFCARALEKVFYKREGVEGVSVNLDDHSVKIDVTEGTNLPDEEITKMVTDAGYNVTEIKR